MPKKQETKTVKSEIVQFPVRSAAKGGKSAKVEGHAKPQNKRIDTWTTNAASKWQTGAVAEGYKLTIDGSMMRVTHIETDTDVFVKCLTVHGETECTRVQKDFVEAGYGILSPEAEAQMQRRKIIRDCSAKISAMLEYFDGVQVYDAMVAKGEFDADIIKEAVANQLAIKDARASE